MTPPPTTLDALAIRKTLGRDTWSPPRPFGPDGWTYLAHTCGGSIIVTAAPWNGTSWIHASIAWANRMPTYHELATLHRAVYRDGWAYQVFAPPQEHVNIHEYALHLWGRADGRPAALPLFGQHGTI